MEHSTLSSFADNYANEMQELTNALALVRTPTPLSVMGTEGLSLGESFGLFFKEFSTNIDKRMAGLSKSVHKVDFSHAETNIRNKKVLFVKNGGLLVLTPQGFRPGLANMAGHTKAVTGGVYLISSLKTEATRLYHWLKQIAKTGRMDSSFRWTVSDFDQAMDAGVNYIKNLPVQDRQTRHPLAQVYVSFEEFFEVVNGFNNSVSLIGARDIELITRELTNVYELGSLIVNKIKANDLLLNEAAIADIESVINRFVELTNVCGAMMALLNELTQVFTEQSKTFEKL
jgi:hypothetical protein